MSKARFLGEAISFFNPMLSLDQTRADWYVEREDEPLERMKIHLLNDRTDTKVLFSGHRGSGKSSLLDKLARDPEIEAKLLVVKFSVKEALNVADLAYTDLLIAIGQRLFEVAEEQAVLSRSLLENLNRWSAQRTVSKQRSSAADAKVMAGIKAWFVEATGTLRTGIQEKQELRQTFEPKIPQLIESINRIIQAVETKKKGGQREVLIIVDDLDKPEVDVVLDLFYKKGPIVTQPQCKIVFTIPTALLYSGDYNLVRGNFSGFFPLPNIKIKEKNGIPSPANWNTMREVVLRRLDRALIDNDALKLAVEMSGGVVRELVRIIHGACTEALAAKKNSVAPQHVEQAVGAIRAEYSYSLTRKEDIEILRQVQQTKQLLHDDEKPLLRLLHMLFILGYPDHPGWYDVNPIVRDLIL